MWHQLWIPVLFPTLIIKSNCDVNKTDTGDVFMVGGHAEADGGYRAEAVSSIKTETPETTTTTVHTTTVKEKPTTMTYEDTTEGVMFIPNSRQVEKRDEEDYDGQNLKIKDIFMMKTINDAMNKDFHVEKKANTPNEDIVFISGKNHDNEKLKPEKEPETGRRAGDEYYQSDLMDSEIISRPKLDCSNLYCSNNIKSICGAKYHNKEWQYRLFLNDCYFRKVNCGLKYEVNRYQQVTLEKCKTVGIHMDKPFSFNRKSSAPKPEKKAEVPTRKIVSSRRSMTMDPNGQLCSHPCPISCPDEYDPQCAISSTGHKRVFLNHCKLDINSCFYGVVWHKRPLAHCVGGKKADMRQNRGFIGWMQRVGIVDNKGRLVLE